MINKSGYVTGKMGHGRYKRVSIQLQDGSKLQVPSDPFWMHMEPFINQHVTCIFSDAACRQLTSVMIDPEAPVAAPISKLPEEDQKILEKLSAKQATELTSPILSAVIDQAIEEISTVSDTAPEIADLNEVAQAVQQAVEDPKGEVVVVTNKLQALRTQAGLSQSELARRSTVKQTVISRLERSDKPITADVAALLAPHLNVTAEELMQ